MLTCSGASSIAIIDLNQADAEAAAKDLVDWFGTSPLCLVTKTAHLQSRTEKRSPERFTPQDTAVTSETSSLSRTHSARSRASSEARLT